MAGLLWKKNTRFALLKDLGMRFEAGMLGVYWWLMRRLSPDRASATGRRLFGWLGSKTPKLGKVLDNLQVAFPGKVPSERRRIARDVLGNFGAVLAEFPHLEAITRTDVENPRLEIINNNHDAAFLAREKPCIFIAAHLGNWELSAYAIQAFGYPVDVVYSPLSNTRLDAMLQASRAPLGCGFITKKNAVRQMYRNLKTGRSVGLHVDVAVEDGELFPFFGTDATTTTTPAWLALKTGCAIVPVHTQRLQGARFRVTFHPAIPVRAGEESDETAIRRATIAMNELIASLISASPGQWWCAKRRWPKAVIQGCAG